MLPFASVVLTQQEGKSVISKHCSSKFCILWQHETNHCTGSQRRALLDKGKILLSAELSCDCVPAK